MAPEVTVEKENSRNPSASTTVSMEEFTSLKSSMETRMGLLHSRMDSDLHHTQYLDTESHVTEADRLLETLRIS